MTKAVPQPAEVRRRNAVQVTVRYDLIEGNNSPNAELRRDCLILISLAQKCAKHLMP